ncbi:MAG: hypothetical protein JWM31_878 [Solirubrobacterales bacterium]|nr:hypothetical protein [Solirubrobacterales bacterium]
METEQIRTAAEAHGRAVVNGDIEHIKADLVDELHPHIPAVAGAVPQPLQSATVLSVDVFEGYAETVTAYASPDRSVEFKSRWEDRGAGRPQIVESAPA